MQSHGYGRGAFLADLPDPRDLLTRVPEWLGYMFVAAFVAVVVGGVVGGLVSIATGAWRVVRYLG